MMAAAILLVVLALAFANGANDNFKAVATLHAAGRLDYRQALRLATVSTLAGSLAAVALAQDLARRFSGRGLVPQAVVGQPAFVLAVASSAAATVLLATRLGFPISTTHALTGALIGAGVVFAGPGTPSFTALRGAFLVPLLVSPLLAFALAGLLRPAVSRIDAWLAESSERHGARAPLSLKTAALLDGLHMASAGAVGFARGLNDVPKIAGLLVGLDLVSPALGLSALALLMAVGGLLAARRVGHTLAFGITRLNGAEGTSANLVTAGLVLLASPLGLPVSTTHVSCGALFGVGATNGAARWRMIAAIAAAWLVTLPAAAAASALAALLLATTRG